MDIQEHSAPSHRPQQVAKLEKLYAEFAADVLAYALRRLPASLADDVVSDVFLVAWRRLDTVPDSALPWLLGVARKTISNHARSIRRQGALWERLEHQPVSVATVAYSHHPALDALATLTQKDQEALMLTAWEGFTNSEAAAALGCSTVAFRVRLHRARARFAHALRQDEEVDGRHCPISGNTELTKGTTP